MEEEKGKSREGKGRRGERRTLGNRRKERGRRE